MNEKYHFLIKNRSSLTAMSDFIYKIVLCTLIVFIFLLSSYPSFADRSATPLREKDGCKAENKSIPVPSIYRELEGVALMISSPSFAGSDSPYATVLSKDNISNVFKESIVKNVLPFIKPSGVDCSIPPTIHEISDVISTDSGELDRVIENPNIITIRVQVALQWLDNSTDRPIITFLITQYRAGFRGSLSPIEVKVLDGKNSTQNINSYLERFRDIKYFFTTE